MTAHVGVGGAYRTVSALYVGVAGAWRQVTDAWVGVAGVWRQFHEAARVNLAGGTVSDAAVSPADASASYSVNNTGTESSSPAAISNTWLLIGSASDYEVRATLNSGTLSSGTTGTWLDCGSSHTWTTTRTLDSGGITTANLTIEIRRKSDGVVQDSATVVLEAEVVV